MIPILLVSDNPALHGGLSRHCRDVGTLIRSMPDFDVAVLGRGIGQRRSIPFLVYDFPESGQWGEGYIKHAWEDFSQGRKGVIITLDDISRRHWFVNTTGLPEELAKFLGKDRDYKKWGYFPIDSTGPNGRTLSDASLDCIHLYDRVSAASEFGYHVLSDSGRPEAQWMPHGFIGDIFKARHADSGFGAVGARAYVNWQPTDIVVGCVMANQSRKDFAALFHCLQVLKLKYGARFRGWIHTDRFIGAWNLYALASTYKLSDNIEVTMDLSDRQLAARYESCDCTVLPTQGEGFGFPILESLACGTNCITTGYAAGAELVAENCRVQPSTFRVEGPHNNLRAVISGEGFARLAVEQIENKHENWQYESERLAGTVEHLEWNKLRFCWERWLRDGVSRW